MTQPTLTDPWNPDLTDEQGSGMTTAHANALSRRVSHKALFSSQWQGLRASLKAWWGDLTEDDLDAVGGRFNKLMLLLQMKYGYTRVRAEAEFHRRMLRYEATQLPTGPLP